MEPMLALAALPNPARDGEWSDDDYDVRDGDRVIGRIFLHPQAPASSVVLDDNGARPSVYNKGYAARMMALAPLFEGRSEM